MLVELSSRVTFTVRDKVRLVLMLGVRVRDVVRVSTFYFLAHWQPAGPHLTHNPCQMH